MDEPLITDKRYDEICKGYLEYIKEIDVSEMRLTDYWNVFKDFDGNTGFDMFSRMELRQRATIARIAVTMGG